MNYFEKTQRVHVISERPEIISSVKNAMQGQEGFEVLDGQKPVKNVMEDIAEIQPDAILLDFQYKGKETYDLVDKITSEFPGSALVVILPEAELEHSEKIILSGARAFLRETDLEERLLPTIQRVLELMGREKLGPLQSAPAEIQRPKNTFIVYSPKGGAGTTTIATNLAIGLLKVLNSEVLLIDGKQLFGHVALFLNLRSPNSLSDLIANVALLDQRMIKQVVVKHISGISVLPSPGSITEAQGIHPDELFKVIQGLQQIYPNIVIDGGSNLNDNTVTYMDSSDKILLVLNPDLASLRDARLFLEICRSLSYPPEKILPILNLTGRKADVKQEEIEKILNVKFLGKVTADENYALSSLNEGIPILIKEPNHPISKAIMNISRELGKIIERTNKEYLNKTNAEVTEILAKSSKLG